MQLSRSLETPSHHHLHCGKGLNNLHHRCRNRHYRFHPNQHHHVVSSMCVMCFIIVSLCSCVLCPSPLQCVLHVSSAQLGAGNLKTGGDTSVCPATNPLLKIIQMFLSFKSTSYKCSSQFPTNPLLKIIELYKSCSHKKFHHYKEILLMWRKSIRRQNIPFWKNTKF